MFTVEERDRARAHLLELAEADSDVTAGAITGSHAAGLADRWSLSRALAAAADALEAELDQADPLLAERLQPVFAAATNSR